MTELFTKLPHWVIRESDLTGNELLLYIAMLSRANRKGICFPSVSLLAKEARMSESTVRRTRASLVNKGLVTVTRRVIGDSRNDTNLYQVALPKKAVKFVDGLSATEPVDNSSSDEFPADENGGHSDGGTSTVKPPPFQGDWSDGFTLTGEEEQVQVDPLKKTLSVSSDAFEFTDLGITDAQKSLLSDLYIHITGKTVPPRTREEWASLTSDAARDLIGRFYENVGRDQDYNGPEYGTPAYRELSSRGKEWADGGMVPFDVLQGAAA